jgi:Sulfotransferase family
MNHMVSLPRAPLLAPIRRSWRRRLDSHFVFRVGERWVAYCYIRKNASSAFKRMILDLNGYEGPWNGAFEFMRRRCAVQTISDVNAATSRVYVYRDPFERTASLFRNKMIMQKDASDFLSNFSRIMGKDPLNATFSEFVHSYLPAKGADPHVWAQSDLLLPVDYNCAWSMDGLLTRARAVFGDRIANRYFSNFANRSSDNLFDEVSADVSVRELRENYLGTGALPSMTALRNDDTDRAIRQIYKGDYKLLAGRDASRAKVGPRWMQRQLLTQ